MVDRLERRQSFQTIAWFRDSYTRGLLDLDPPYQRRSVWNQQYREFFIETVLLRYPAPAIFVHEAITPEGAATYSIVDGKQRLTTIFEFASDEFPVGKDSQIPELSGMKFSSLDDATKHAFWTYQFSVEYLPATDEGTLTNVFDRINRNVSRLTAQELRHARFSGEFASLAEVLNDYLVQELPEGVPNIALASRRQMKDVELVAQLLLYIEAGHAQSYSQNDLDVAYSDRDTEWNKRQEVEQDFRSVVGKLKKLFTQPEMGAAPLRRIKNQADFYSLFGVYVDLERTAIVPKPEQAAVRLQRFFEIVGDPNARESNSQALRYFDAARSASNDLRQRSSRIEIITNVLAAS